MNLSFLFIILVVGLSGIVAQVLFLRELLIIFYGNELTVGIILANWILSEAIGVFLVGKYIDKVRNKINIFIILELIFCISLPLFLYLGRIFKDLMNIPFGQGLSLFNIFYLSLIIIFLSGFSHGALFSSSCAIYRSIGKIYSFEMLGTILGGLIFTYLLIPYFHTFKIAFLIILLNLFICFFIIKDTHKVLKYILILSLILVIGLFLISIDTLQQSSLKYQYKIGKVLDYQDSIYGNIVVNQRENQLTFFYNGLPLITSPYPDITFVEEFGHLPLLFQENPEDILIISGGAGGLINEILKHPIKRIDYVELDPLIIKMLKKYPSLLTNKELEDKRVNIINTDGRFFIRGAKNKYDIILIGINQPNDLSINRFFTQEFFNLTKKRLKNEGILAFCLPGSLTYLSKELRDLNFCILNALKSVFNYVRIIPGDYNMFLASGSNYILEVDASLIVRRLKEKKIQTHLLVPAYLEYRLHSRWLNWFKEASLGATEKINQDNLPFALFKMLALWNRQFSPKFSIFFERLEKIDLKKMLIFILLFTLALFFIFSKNAYLAKLSIAYSIFTTGFFGMLANLILIFSFQIYYGYLYYKIGLLMSIFMAGISLGSLLMTRIIKKIKQHLKLFMVEELSILIFSAILAVFLNRLITWHIPLFFIAGFLVGVEFPLASHIYLKDKNNLGETAGILYSADLVGGWLAGIAGGVLILPLLGLVNACFVIMGLKLGSFLLLAILGFKSYHSVL